MLNNTELSATLLHPGVSSSSSSSSGITNILAKTVVNETIPNSSVPLKVALITGITGQAGSYLAELLLEKGYIVHGIIRRASSFNTTRINHLYQQAQESKVPKFHLHFGDLTDTTSLIQILTNVKPTEIYNLAAQSHVKVSFELPEYTAEVDALGTLRLLNAICVCGLHKTTKFYQASTSELYGNALTSPQSETTPFNPRSPYAIAKLYAYWITLQYRDAYGMFACNGILFNHESPRRGPTFVTKKITMAVARIQCQLQHVLQLGNLDAKRDWGHAKDYVYGMWLMLQQQPNALLNGPQTYVLATGETHTVREFVEIAFEVVGMHIRWEGTGLSEIGKDQHGIVRVQVDAKYFRPTEVYTLLGDASKAKQELGWQPKVTFKELIQEMVLYDLEHVKKEHLHH